MADSQRALSRREREIILFMAINMVCLQLILSQI